MEEDMWFMRRGKDFERRVEAALDATASAHPDVISVVRQPTLPLNDGTFVRPDFRVTIRMPHITDILTIECQSRRRSSNELQHKIRTMKSLSEVNRVAFVYEDDAFLAEANRKALIADGVTLYDFEEFLAYLARLNGALSAIGSSPKLIVPEEFAHLAAPPATFLLARKGEAPNLDELRKRLLDGSLDPADLADALEGLPSTDDWLSASLRKKPVKDSGMLGRAPRRTR